MATQREKRYPGDEIGETECQLAAFLAGSLDPSDSLATNKAQMLQRLAYIAENGPPRNTDISHQISEDIFQIEKGSIRALYFYGLERRTLVFSHGFVKTSQKTKRADIERAQACLRDYKKAHQAGKLIVLKE